MIQVRPSLLEAGDSEVLCRGAAPERSQLGIHEPHPMRDLGAVANFGQCVVVDVVAVLCIDEA